MSRADKFSRVFDRFETSKSRIERKELISFLHQYDESLAKAFAHFARSLTPGEAIKCAKSQNVCVACKNVFVPPKCKVCASCLKTEAGKELASRLKSQTFTQLFKDSEFRDLVRSKKQATSLKHYGTLHPSQHPSVAKAQSKAIRSKEAQDKRKATCLSNWGVEHQAQHPLVLKRMLKNATSLKTVCIGQKTFECQGYEPFVLRRLAHMFGANQIVSQFDPKFQAIRLPKYWFTPDFYVKSKQTYVEVKSLWTLGVQNTDWLNKNKARHSWCLEQGIKLKYVVCVPEKQKIVQLPKHWPSLTAKQLKSLVLDV